MPDRAGLDPLWSRFCDDISSRLSAADAVGALGRALALRAGFPAWPELRLAEIESPRCRLDLPVGADGRWLGPVYERLLHPSARRSQGAHFTPGQVATGLVRLALPEMSSAATVLDPAVGGGAFLLAAADELAERGAHRATVVSEQLWGVDIDPVAVAVTEAALALWAWEAGVVAIVGEHLVVADTLGPVAPFNRETFDVVVGNPPFRSQLATATTRSSSGAAGARRRFGQVAKGYVDDAGLFLLAALDHCRGRVVLVQPLSILSTASAHQLRRTVADRAALVGLWSASAVFEASVDVCALALEPGSASTEVQLHAGPDVQPMGPPAIRPGPDAWATLLADREMPTVVLEPGPVLGDLATATAGFRDQHYGLAPHAVDDPDGDRSDLPRLVNVGLIEPLHCEWGERPVRFAKHRWERPRLDLGRLRAVDARLAGWVDARLEPKVVVATQTKVIEAAVDRAGDWVPSTPAISVHAPVADLDRVAAVLVAPPLSAWARRRYVGAGLSVDVIKLAAKQLLDLPLPAGRRLWREAAGLVAAEAGETPRERHERLLRIGRLMTMAYGEPDDVFEWWRSRLREPRS